MEREMIEIQLTPEERSLLMRYGYPFTQIENALKACEASNDIEIVLMDCFELEHLIGDVCRSINHLSSGATQHQLLNLCDRLQAAEEYGDGMLDVLRASTRSRRLCEPTLRKSTKTPGRLTSLPMKFRQLQVDRKDTNCCRASIESPRC